MKRNLLKSSAIAGLLMVLFFADALSVKSQTIEIDSIFTADGEIFPFEPGDTIYGLSISGTVQLFSDTSLVRVILSDIYGNEWMVYEAYPMIVEDTIFEIEEECDETCYLNEFLPEKIEIQIIDSRILIDDLTLDNIPEENIEELRRISLKSKELQKISSINSYLASNKMLWRAGETSLSSSTYSEKKAMFGEKYCLIGYEFYVGGIYAPFRVTNSISIESNIVDSFDWRNRHGADNPSSYYFDGNPDIYIESCG